MDKNSWRARIACDSFESVLRKLYGEETGKARERLSRTLDLFEKTFPEREDIRFFSAPGRTEIGGNHTDHQRGRVLAASVNMDTVAAAAKTDGKEIRILSEGYPMCVISLDDLGVHDEEKNTTASLVRGVAAAFSQRGCPVGGFEAALTSTVLPGSGISSSAAFEVLVGNIINGLYWEKKMTPVEIAQIGQYAENVYFGKPSGLMDQMASSVGNLVTIDFEDPEKPVVRQLDVDFEQCGLALCIIDSGADHADLTDEYAAIPNELGAVCREFGKSVLREIPRETFIEAIPRIRRKVGDRALLRAMHVYDDNQRVSLQVKALEEGNTDTFLQLVNESGHSSWLYLQNIIPAGAKLHQEMAVALASCELLLQGRGACRVHGGGFAGTVQAFVPLDMLETFKSGINRILGEGSCHVLSIRGVGGCEIPESGEVV